MFLFLGVLILGLVYVWVKGDLDWIKPKPTVPTTNVAIPASLYDKLSAEQSTHVLRPFNAPVEPVTVSETAVPTTQPIRKPMFKPTFKKASDE
jgi:NADH-quinone oxidoreductase subunit A